LLRLLSCSSSSTHLSVCSEVEETLTGAWSCFFFRILLGKEKCQLQRALPDRIVSDFRRIPIVDPTVEESDTPSVGDS